MATDLVLHWPRPAENWFAAAPIGNGRLGAMVFGGARQARLQLNDSTVWSGTPSTPRAGLTEVLAAGAGADRLAQVRAAVRAGDHRTAELLLMSFEGRYSQEYLPFADLLMTLPAAADTDYHGRTLNLDNGVASECFTVDGHQVERRTWASRPARAVCVALTVEQGTVDLRLELGSPLRVVHRLAVDTGLRLGLEIPVDGAPLHEEAVAEPLRYADGPLDGYDPFGAVALAVDTDGAVSQSGDGLTIRGLSRLLVTLASSTAAADAWAVPPGRPVPDSASREQHLRRAADTASVALAAGPEELLRAHEADLRGLLGRMRLTIGSRRGGTVDVAEEVLSGKDEQLTATVLVQYGRYLLAASSRPLGGPPANLQGLWNEDLRPAWSSNYTLNINTEMNYWGAEVAGLGECHEPLFRLIERLADTGGAVATGLYGARGWVAHHNSDMWGWALPVGFGHGNPSWAIWLMGGTWLVQHVWEHVEFSQDLDFLRDRGWPLLRGCAEFCLDWLVEGPDGRLDTIPSTSPENLFVVEGGPASLTWSTTMDIALIRALFERCLAAAGLLGLADPVCAEIRAALPRLRPPGATADGRLREWAVDHVEADPQHRHMSQLVTVYPLGQIDPASTPELATAAARVLDRRGPGAMGWSWAWKIALRARLGDAATARELLLEASRPLGGDLTRNAPVDGSEWGGLLPNLFSSHPPVQLDGNYGLLAAVLEMLVQSHNGVIRVLPAVPEQWPDGSARGLRCRGGLAVDLDWHGGRLATLTARRLAGAGESPLWIEYRESRRELRLAVGAQVHLDAKLMELDGC